MKYVIAVLVILGLNACSPLGMFNMLDTTSSGGDVYIYKGINFGSNRTESFKKGVVDGCATAAGDYRKDYVAFKEEQNYRMGWGDGRLQCYNINKKKENR